MHSHVSKLQFYTLFQYPVSVALHYTVFTFLSHQFHLSMILVSRPLYPSCYFVYHPELFHFVAVSCPVVHCFISCCALFHVLLCTVSLSPCRPISCLVVICFMFCGSLFHILCAVSSLPCRELLHFFLVVGCFMSLCSVSCPCGLFHVVCTVSCLVLCCFTLSCTVSRLLKRKQTHLFVTHFNTLPTFIRLSTHTLQPSSATSGDGLGGPGERRRVSGLQRRPLRPPSQPHQPLASC